MKVDKGGPVPIGRQIEQLVSELIESGEFAPGQRLPTEMELCERLGVSRTPVRQALGNLVSRGMLVRHPGRGTFVADRRKTISNIRETSELSITVPEERWCWPIQQALQIWNNEHPDQEVRLRFHMVGQSALRERLMHSVAQGTATDLTLLDSAWVAEFADRGYLRSLASIDPAIAGAMTADLIHPLLAENTVRGELYALPADADFALLWYRRDWFASESLTPPRTWEELLACAGHFQRSAVRDRYDLGLYPLTFAGGARAGETTAYQLLPFLWANSADVIAKHRVVLNSRRAKAAVAFVAGLVRKHGVAARRVVESEWNGPALAFASGRVAMSFGGSYEGALIRAASGWDEARFLERAGFMPIPAGPDGTQATVLGGLSYGIFRQSSQPVRALAVLQCAFRPEVLRIFCAQTGQNPPTISATQSLMVETEPFLHATAQFFTYARPRWPMAEYARVSAQLVHMFESTILGEATPDEAVAKAAAVISGITGFPERSRSNTIWQTTPRSGSRTS